MSQSRRIKIFHSIYISQRLDQTLGNLFNPINSQVHQLSQKALSQIRHFISVLTLFKQIYLSALQTHVLILVGFTLLIRNRFQTANSQRQQRPARDGDDDADDDD